jgi:magnesium-transporting ATPase (P-type)
VGVYAKIKTMKAELPKPTHESYKKHRKQLISQILLPMVIVALLFVAMIVLINVATFRSNGDVARWAAISTIWIVIPIMIVCLIFLAVLVGLVYLMKRLLSITPVYTGLAQDFVQKLMSRIQDATDAIVKPVIFWDSVGASINRFLGRK